MNTSLISTGFFNSILLSMFFTISLIQRLGESSFIWAGLTTVAIWFTLVDVFAFYAAAKADNAAKSAKHE